MVIVVCMKSAPIFPLRKYALSALVVLALNSNAFAQSDEEEALPDARLSGYSQIVQNTEGNVLSWFAMVGLGTVCLLGLFKNAKRSHLD